MLINEAYVLPFGIIVMGVNLKIKSRSGDTKKSL